MRDAKVVLKADLTEWHDSLVPGLEGDPCGRLDARFVRVRFPDVELDVLLRNLEIVPQAKIAVRLTQDLRRYHPSLLPGVEGYAIGAYGEWSRGNDRFTGVVFPEVTLDILWSGLEIIDEAYLREREERRRARETRG